VDPGDATLSFLSTLSSDLDPIWQLLAVVCVSRAAAALFGTMEI
jgi:hypothetical protein